MILEIEHIDGNAKNNREENLDLICPNCHSLTSTYKALNSGKGNRDRLKYNKLI
ncbi:MAG: HNH endonuclease [archaeon]